MRLSAIMLAGWTLAWSGLAVPEPYLPTQDSQVLARVTVVQTQTPSDLKRLRNTVRREPDNLEVALSLANAYLTAARQQADPRYYGYIQTALAPWWDRAEPPSEVLLIRATTRAARHDFDAALEDLAHVLRIEPRNAQAWLSRAVMLTVTSRYEEAIESCLPLSLLADHLLADACLAHAASLKGRAPLSAELLGSALRTSQSRDSDIRRWALSILADINNRIGRVVEAEKRYLAALELGVLDVHLRAAYADFLLERGRPEEVLALLSGEPLPDVLLLRLAIAELALNRPSLAAHLADLEDRFADADLRGEDVHLRERARYTLELLRQPAPALELALRNWGMQREPADARLVLEAALAAGMADAAEPVLRWRARTGIEDVRLAELADRLENP